MTTRTEISNTPNAERRLSWDVTTDPQVAAQIEAAKLVAKASSTIAIDKGIDASKEIALKVAIDSRSKDAVGPVLDAAAPAIKGVSAASAHKTIDASKWACRLM